MQTVKTNEIKFTHRYRKQLGDLTTLQDSINLLGLLHPVVINEKNQLIAGARRLQACINLGWTEIPVTQLNIVNLLQGELDENLIRKDFVPSEIVEIKRAIASTKEGHRPKKGTESAPFPKGKSVELAAKISGSSRDTIQKMEKIMDAGLTDVVKRIDDTEDKLTINDAYKTMVKDQKKKERTQEISKTQVTLPDSIALFNEPFQELRRKDNSVALIFTDPPYDRDSLPLYEDLAKQAVQVLREGGSLFCYGNNHYAPIIISMMEKHGLTYQWTMTIIHSGPSATVHHPPIMVGNKPLFWFTKGKYEGDYLRDTIKSEYQGKELHEWAQSTVESDYYIEHTTFEDEIVYDPFLGAGTFGISALKLKRQFIGCEIDKDHFETARNNIGHN